MASIATAHNDQKLGQKHPKPLEEAVVQDGAERPQLPLSKRILRVLWNSLDKPPEERKFVAKIDWWILSYCCVAYFVKYLDQTNVRSNECPSRYECAFADHTTGHKCLCVWHARGYQHEWQRSQLPQHFLDGRLYHWTASLPDYYHESAAIHLATDCRAPVEHHCNGYGRREER